MLGGADTADEDVQGFLFQTLKYVSSGHAALLGCVSLSCRTQHPDLSEKLDEFRKHLLLTAREMPELKAWQLQGIM